MYRVGFPGWKVAAHLRVPLTFRVWVHQDVETGTYWAESDDLDGFIATGDTLPEIRKSVEEVAEAMLNSELGVSHPRAKPDLRLGGAIPCAA